MPTVELNGRTAPGFACPPGSAEKVYWSAELPGFGLRCRASGARSWFVQYRTKGGETRKHSLGDPQTVGLRQGTAGSSAADCCSKTEGRPRR